MGAGVWGSGCRARRAVHAGRADRRRGMGTVWRADDAVLARSVAVKILHSALFEDDTFIQRFRREAQLVAAIDHPAVVDVHDYGESGGSGDAGEGDASDKGGEAGGDAGERCAYIVMELVDGRPLDRVLAAEGPMPPSAPSTWSPPPWTACTPRTGGRSCTGTSNRPT